MVDNPVGGGAEDEHGEHARGRYAPTARNQQQREGNREDSQGDPRDQLFDPVPVAFGGQLEGGGEDADGGQRDEAAAHEHHKRPCHSA